MERVKYMLTGYKNRQKLELTRHDKGSAMHEMKIGEVLGLNYALRAMKMHNCKKQLEHDVRGFHKRLKCSARTINTKYSPRMVGTINAVEYAIELLRI